MANVELTMHDVFRRIYDRVILFDVLNLVVDDVRRLAKEHQRCQQIS